MTSTKYLPVLPEMVYFFMSAQLSSISLCLCSCLELFISVTDVFIKVENFLFRVDPDCDFGLILKAFFKKEALVRFF